MQGLMRSKSFSNIVLSLQDIFLNYLMDYTVYLDNDKNFRTKFRLSKYLSNSLFCNSPLAVTYRCT